ncbi:MAG: hypothetical protein JXR96_05150 [Deltaproteobacteria bacterium]|nr:hypothetical protein [Deltaproteobacteria bacterium]
MPAADRETRRPAIPSWLLLGIPILCICVPCAAQDDWILPTVPPDHPRVYLRSSDVDAIREKIHLDGFREDYEMLTEGGSSFGPCPYSVCYAFRALVEEKGTAPLCREAIRMALEDLGATGDDDYENLRKLGNPMHYGALVYDWCYAEMTEDDRQQFVSEFIRIAGLDCSPIGYPADPSDPDVHSVTGHGSESWLLTSQLPVGVAIFDEDPLMYTSAAAVFLTRFAEVRDYFYPAHMHHQGDSYITSRFQNDQLASWLFRRLGAGDVLSVEQQFVPYQLMYNLRPDLQQMRMGDTWDSGGRSPDKKRLVMLTGSYYRDPYLLYMADSGIFLDYFYDTGIHNNAYFDRILRLIFKPVEPETEPIDSLPLTAYFPAPMSEMVARSGWELGPESRDAVVRMRIGQTFFGTHQRKDFGTWQIYFRGALAISSGFYAHMGCNEPHFRNYYSQTIAQNGLLILDPDEQMMRDGVPVANDGGQHWVGPSGATFARNLDELLNDGFEMGIVTARQFGPDPISPEYSYLSGDITGAYSSDKAALVTRSMAALWTGDETRPLILVVYDRVVATEPGFRKTWLMHTIDEPIVEGKKITVARSDPKNGYDGKLVAECLLPQNAQIATIGGEGYRFWIADPLNANAGTNWDDWGEKDSPQPIDEIGDWRVEVSPAVEIRSDRFLHVMSVMEGGSVDRDRAELIQSDALIGAKKRGLLVMFGRGRSRLESASFDLLAESACEALICDLQAGRWCVDRDGQNAHAGRVTGDGSCLRFTALPGRYSLKRQASCSSAGPDDESGSGEREEDGPVGREGGREDADEPKTQSEDGDADELLNPGCSCGAGGSASVHSAVLLVIALGLLVSKRRAALPPRPTSRP